jgi:hypothetical protein
LDGSKAGRPKILSTDQDNPWVEALTPANPGFDAPDAISFPVSAISYTRSLGPAASLIKLASGPELFFSLPLAQLQERLRAPEDGVADLKAATLLENKEPLVKRLSEEFQARAAADKAAALGGITVKAWVRVPNGTEFKLLSFSSKDVDLSGATEGGSIFGGKNTRFTTKDSAGGPFGNGTFLLECELADFVARCVKAWKEGQKEIDLAEYSLRKGREPREKPQGAPQP